MNLMKISLSQFCYCFILLCIFGTTVRPEANISDNNYDALVVTVASESTDGFLRYMRSARVYDIPIMVLGMQEQWKGGNMQGAGGGYKINLLREALETYKDDSKKIVLFTDSYDVVFTAGLEQIVPNFLKTNARILFSAEKYCWPAPELSEKYPIVESAGSRFLNSGGFIGYASELYKLLATPVADTDDDQLYYTKHYLNESLRASLDMQLDTKSVIFQNLNGAKHDVKLNVNLDSNEGVLENIRFNTQPFIIHGNGPSKLELNSYANYLAKTFNGECLICQENRLELDENNLPVISLSVMSTMPVPFFDMFLQKIEKLNYPKQKMHLFVYCQQQFNEALAKSFVNRMQNEYASAKIILHTDELTEHRARQLAVQQARSKKSDYLFFVDADAHIDDAELLRELLITNKQFIAPVFTKHNELWSNFWGAMSDTGYYARSHDYVDIVKQQIVGMWNVPYVSSVYLIKNTAFKHLNYDHAHFDADMAMCHSLRQAGIFLNVMNTRIFGHLVNADDFDTSVTRADFYTLFSNKYDWIKKYIHEEYAKQLEDNVTIPQPCTDVFWFRIGTEAFCDDIVAIMEAFGKWSDGSNKDQRLEGGYEAVPTRDIHMKQVGLDVLWLQFLQTFVRPLQEKVFAGYFHNPPRSLMNFVVRYRPDEQPFLRPHHDSSTYTINIALNQVGVDYEGGGCRFLRYNCSVQATRKGWMLMHPGRLTHYHEGLRTTNGTRYIMISFVDP